MWILHLLLVLCRLQLVFGAGCQMQSQDPNTDASNSSNASRLHLSFSAFYTHSPGGPSYVSLGAAFPIALEKIQANASILSNLTLEWSSCVADFCSQKMFLGQLVTAKLSFNADVIIGMKRFLVVSHALPPPWCHSAMCVCPSGGLSVKPPPAHFSLKMFSTSKFSHFCFLPVFHTILSTFQILVKNFSAPKKVWRAHPTVREARRDTCRPFKTPSSPNSFNLKPRHQCDGLKSTHLCSPHGLYAEAEYGCTYWNNKANPHPRRITVETAQFESDFFEQNQNILFS